MANGLLGKVVSVANTDVVAYTAPAGVQFVTVSLNCVNRGAVESAIRVAITTAAVPAATDYVEYGALLVANGGVLERTCLLMSANEKLFVWADSATVTARAYGLEQL